MDSREKPPAREALQQRHPQVETVFGGFDAARLRAAGTLIVSPGVPLTQPDIAAAVHAGVQVLGDIELFARVAPAPVVAITGSNGKSTVTSLLAHMVEAAGLSVRAGGNLSPPALDLLHGDVPDFYLLGAVQFPARNDTLVKAPRRYRPQC